MATQFPRIWKVTAVFQPQGFVANNPQFFERTGNGIEIVATRVSFTVKRNLSKTPNQCEIRLYNLSEHTRRELERLPVQVMLHAGHNGVAKMLSRGDLVRSWSEREGTEIVTTLVVRDGMRAFAHARMNRSYKPPISAAKVLSDAAKSMGLTLPPEIERSAELRQALADGISTKGATRDVLTRLLAPYNYHWSVQNGRLLIVRDEDVAPGEELLISKETGLLGSPKKRAPDKPKAKQEIDFELLVNGDIGPARRVRLRSEFFDVSLKIVEVEHVGDSHGDEFTTKCTGRPR